MLHYSYDGGPFLTVPLTHVAGDLFEALLPPPSCGDLPAYYFSAAGSLESTVYFPADGPANPLRASVGTLIVLLDDNFQNDLGWTVWNDPTLTTGAWQRAVPLSSGTVGAPFEDYDGSGRCFVTDNRSTSASDYFDVDFGPTILTSPVVDASVCRGFGAEVRAGSRATTRSRRLWIICSARSLTAAAPGAHATPAVQRLGVRHAARRGLRAVDGPDAVPLQRRGRRTTRPRKPASTPY